MKIVWELRTAALHGVAAVGSEVIKPELCCEAGQILIRDARRPAFDKRGMSGRH